MIYELTHSSDLQERRFALIVASQFTANHSLQAGEVIQLASFLLTKTQLQTAKILQLIFLAFDARLLTVAKSKGSPTADPQNYCFLELIAKGAKINDSDSVKTAFKIWFDKILHRLSPNLIKFAKNY